MVWPLQMITPILEEIAVEKAGAVKIVEVNVRRRQWPLNFQMLAIPTLLFLKNSQMQEQVVGMIGKRELLAKIDALA